MNGEIPISLPKDRSRTYRRRAWRGTAAAAALTLFAAPLASGCGSGIPNQPEACKPFATSIFQKHPALGKELSCFYPEIASQKHTIIPVDANSTIFNFTDHEVNVEAVRNTFAFFNEMADSPRPIFLNQKDIDFFVSLGDKKIYGAINQRFFGTKPEYARAYFIAPAKDNAVVSDFTLNTEANDIYDDDPAHTPAYTNDNIGIGTKQVPVTASYVYLPGPNSYPGDTILEYFNTEMCQSIIQGFSTVKNNFKNYQDYADYDVTVQESACNTLAQALTDVQRGMTRENFINTYANPNNISQLIGGAPAATIPLQPWLYDAMKAIKPAIAVGA